MDRGARQRTDRAERSRHEHAARRTQGDHALAGRKRRHQRHQRQTGQPELPRTLESSLDRLYCIENTEKHMQLVKEYTYSHLFATGSDATLLKGKPDAAYGLRDTKKRWSSQKVPSRRSAHSSPPN